MSEINFELMEHREGDNTLLRRTAAPSRLIAFIVQFLDGALSHCKRVSPA
jgi:hypothetical protein